MHALSTIENGPANCNHARSALSSRFPIDRKRQAVLLVSQAAGISIVHEQGRQNTKQG